MGKNTMMRKAIRGHLDKNPDLERLLPHIKQNVGVYVEALAVGATMAAPWQMPLHRHRGHLQAGEAPRRG